jgi:SAM-dependent methyltransferase
MTARSPFDPLVDAYDAARPSYPAALYAALDELAGPLNGARVVEVGAGTGIATRELRRRGAWVLAVDIGSAMLSRLRAHSPAQAAAVADGHALPVRDNTLDLVCYAQAWHWMRVAPAAAEAVRVLRPGGAFACWWNDVDAAGEAWWVAQQDRLERWNLNYRRDYRGRDHVAELRRTDLFTDVEERFFSWQREVDLDTYETWLRSKSYVAALGPRLEEFIAAERASLSAAFPTGSVVEPFRARLVTARRS